MPAPPSAVGIPAFATRNCLKTGLLAALIERLGDDAGLVCQAAVQALCRVGATHPEVVIPPLLDRLQSPNVAIGVRQGALGALGRVGAADPSQVIQLLLDHLDDWEASSAARDALRDLVEVSPDARRLVRSAKYGPHFRAIQEMLENTRSD